MKRRRLRARLADGRLYLGSEEAECGGLADGANLALLREGRALWLFPLRGAAHGGFFLKRRNARGDLVLSAADFFRREGLEGSRPVEIEFTWDEDRSAFVARSLFPAN